MQLARDSADPEARALDCPVTTYVIRRLLQTVVMLFVLSIMFFLLARYQPTSSCQNVGCNAELHFDQPVANQYVFYLNNLLHGNFGESFTGTQVGILLQQRLPATILLIGISFVLQQMIALPLGIFAALRQYSLPDQAMTFASYLFLSTPAYVLGFFLIAIFWWNLGWLPNGRSVDLSLPLIGSQEWWSLLRNSPALVLGDLLRHLILPAFTLIATGIAIDSRFMRAAMLQVLHEDYIRTARAKGASRRSVIFKHAFRNALLPIITNIGLYLPALIGGTVIVEATFGWDGVGSLYAASVGGYIPDFTVLESLLLLSAVSVLLANLLADIAYAWLDPRIRYDASGAE